MTTETTQKAAAAAQTELKLDDIKVSPTECKNGHSRAEFFKNGRCGKCASEASKRSRAKREAANPKPKPAPSIDVEVAVLLKDMFRNSKKGTPEVRAKAEEFFKAVIPAKD